MAINVNFPKQISLFKERFFMSFFLPSSQLQEAQSATPPQSFSHLSFHCNSRSTRMRPLDFPRSPRNPNAWTGGRNRFFPKPGVHSQPPRFTPAPALLLMAKEGMSATFVDRKVIFLSDQTGKQMRVSLHTFHANVQESGSWLFEGRIVLQLSCLC